MFRAGKCRISAVPSGFYSTVHLTVQCGVQWYLIYNTVQCAMQPRASHTILWTLYSTMCNAVYRPVHQTVILQHNVSYSSVWRRIVFNIQYSAMCNANTSIPYNLPVSSSDGAHGSRDRRGMSVPLRTGLETDDIC